VGSGLSTAKKRPCQLNSAMVCAPPEIALADDFTLNRQYDGWAGRVILQRSFQVESC
jgi:hypothetical protein